MEDECFPAIPMNTACTRLSPEVVIKDEPFSETESIHSSCPSSPQPANLNDTCTETYLTETPTVISPILSNEFPIIFCLISEEHTEYFTTC